MQFKPFNRYIIFTLVLLTVCAKANMVFATNYVVSDNIIFGENDDGTSALITRNSSGTGDWVRGSFILNEEDTLFIKALFKEFKSIADGNVGRHNALLEYFASRINYYSHRGVDIHTAIMLAYIETITHFNVLSSDPKETIRGILDELPDELPIEGDDIP